MFTSIEAAERRALELSAETGYRHGIFVYIQPTRYHYEWRYEVVAWPY